MNRDANPRRAEVDLRMAVLPPPRHRQSLLDCSRSEGLCPFGLSDARAPIEVMSATRFTLGERVLSLFGALRFLWNATRGHRLAPWRSEFLRWRVETYSGKPAESLRARDVFGFMWESKWELLSFLFWAGRLEGEARRKT